MAKIFQFFATVANALVVLDRDDEKPSKEQQLIDAAMLIVDRLVPARPSASPPMPATPEQVAAVAAAIAASEAPAPTMDEMLANERACEAEAAAADAALPKPGTPEMAQVLAERFAELHVVAHAHELAKARAAVPMPPTAPPVRVGREIIPLSSGGKLLKKKGKAAQMTARVNGPSFKPERFFISGSETPGGAADWLIHDISIAGRSQFAQAGDVPGDVFAANSVDCRIDLDVAQTGTDVVVVASYIGPNKKGAAFFGSIIGSVPQDVPLSDVVGTAAV